MKHVDKAFISFFKLLQKKREGKYDSRVSIPHYKPKDDFYILDFPDQMFQVKDQHIRIGVPKFFREEYGYDLREIRIPFTYEDVKKHRIKHLTILFKNNRFQYRLIYEIEKEPIKKSPGTFLSIDCGVDNFATCVDHTGRSFILDGRGIKSLNRWYNKELSRLRGIKDKQGTKGGTKRMSDLFDKRFNRVQDYLNKAVSFIVDYCKMNRIGAIIVGDARGWKQRSNMNKKNNQNFVGIPFDGFKQKLKGKCERYEMDYRLVDESYTSKCSFLDAESVEKHDSYLGRRIKRGLFESKDGVLINADVNGALNIAQKCFTSKPEMHCKVGSSGTVAVPLRIREPFDKANIG
jgi:IS605 OrfB family transposase